MRNINKEKNRLIRKQNELKEYSSGLSNSCKEKPEDTYRWDETVHKYENTDMYMDE